MAEFLTASEAAGLVTDGATVLITGSGGGLMDADHAFAGIEERFLATGSPRDLTLVHVTGIGNRAERGVSRFAHEGMVRRVVGGHWGWSPAMVQLALDNKIEAYNLPQGVLSLLTREIAAGRRGLLTRVGLHTFVDPRLGGGKLNERATAELVRLVRFEGEDLLFYPSFPIGAAVIRGTTADDSGNISTEQEAADLDVLSAAQAAYNSGGVVIAQVKRVVQRHQIPARQVTVPGFMVTAVVVYPDQWQTVEGEYNLGYSGERRAPVTGIAPLARDSRLWVARRAALELRPGAVVNLGFGIADGVANVAAEESIFDRIVFCIEQGLVGGLPAKGDIFGASFNPDAFLDAPSQFDFFHGGGLDLACLGMAQIDAEGNVNVSRFGKAIPGSGGFIDISQNAKRLVFCGTFTAGGADVRAEDGRIRIVKEGHHRKFVRRVEHVTFSGPYARRLGREVLYVTERAVFRLGEDGLVLTEVAPGVDLKRDVLDLMDFAPSIPSAPDEMDVRILGAGPMGLVADPVWIRADAVAGPMGSAKPPRNR